VIVTVKLRDQRPKPKNRLCEDSFVRDESSASNADVAVIPSQHKVTQQILSH
jgi:hypothetical protein